MSDNEQRGGVAEERYPSANEQMDIIRDALDFLAEAGFLLKVSAGNYAIGPWRLRFSVVFGEVTATLIRRETGAVIDQYVGQHPLVWMLDGALTPDFIVRELHTFYEHHQTV